MGEFETLFNGIVSFFQGDNWKMIIMWIYRRRAYFSSHQEEHGTYLAFAHRLWRNSYELPKCRYRRTTPYLIQRRYS